METESALKISRCAAEGDNAGDRSWLASLALEFSNGARGTRLTGCRHVGPLYVQKPFYPEGKSLAHVYLLHPPGGLVSGDHLKIDIKVNQHAAALVTTPGAARIYRARQAQPLQRQSVRFQVADQASLEWFPLETIVYNEAHVELDTEIHLGRGSGFIGWEINCFGLTASNAPFEAGTFQQSYRVFREGRPLFVDRFVLDEANRAALLSGVAGMQGQGVSGFLLMGPCVLIDEEKQKVLERLRQVVKETCSGQVAISKSGDCFVGRYLGDSAEQARKVFTAWWEVLRPLILGREACAPRIWST